jgi:hypothetical protein
MSFPLLYVPAYFEVKGVFIVKFVVCPRQLNIMQKSPINIFLFIVVMLYISSRRSHTLAGNGWGCVARPTFGTGY